MCSQIVARATTVPRERVSSSRMANSRAVSSIGAPARHTWRAAVSIVRSPSWSVGRRVAVGAANHGVDAGDELRERERLGQVVVGAKVEAADAIVNHVAGGQDEHRRPDAVGASRLQHRPAVELRQHQVENDGVVRHLPDLEERLFAVLGEIDGELPLPRAPVEASARGRARLRRPEASPVAPRSQFSARSAGRRTRRSHRRPTRCRHGLASRTSGRARESRRCRPATPGCRRRPARPEGCATRRHRARARLHRPGGSGSRERRDRAPVPGAGDRARRDRNSRGPDSARRCRRRVRRRCSLRRTDARICAGCCASRTASENPPAADGVGKMDQVTIRGIARTSHRAGACCRAMAKGKPVAARRSRPRRRCARRPARAAPSEQREERDDRQQMRGVRSRNVSIVADVAVSAARRLLHRCLHLSVNYARVSACDVSGRSGRDSKPGRLESRRVHLMHTYSLRFCVLILAPAAASAQVGNRQRPEGGARDSGAGRMRFGWTGAWTRPSGAMCPR